MHIFDTGPPVFLWTMVRITFYLWFLVWLTVKMENWAVGIQVSEEKELAWRISMMLKYPRLMGKQFVFLEYLMVGLLPGIELWLFNCLLLNSKDSNIIVVFDVDWKASLMAITRKSELLSSISCWNGSNVHVWLVQIHAKIGVSYCVNFA